MRAFIAIDLPPQIKDAISKTQDKFKNALPKISWVKPVNLHLTLKFLGEISPKQLDLINQIIDKICSKANNFKIRLEAMDLLPDIARARIIWIGTEKIEAQLQQIVEELETKLSQLGIPKEKRHFCAHITIGRIKTHIAPSILEETLGKLKNGLLREKLKFAAEKITLFQSTLGPAGPDYAVLKEANFKIT
ncbi:MAG: RNA 2',3'-cyclic phosphodiesterase [Candidatus Omnitrophica bacterium CG11_big_fil_rev_8_21_14_0_20_41_12]|nr:MAG: RNA 2',3'-cyclic phosphodiesterase [Candidatus Omnitrophica bacterium CG11_big_fil_rev_8_21_14_0_20_41_12]